MGTLRWVSMPTRVVKAAVRGRSKTLRRQLFPFRCDLSGVSRYVSGCGGVSSVGRGIVIVRDVLFSFDVNVYRSVLIGPSACLNLIGLQ